MGKKTKELDRRRRRREDRRRRGDEEERRDVRTNSLNQKNRRGEIG